MEKLFSFKLNGRQVSVSAPPACTILEVLREKLDVTGPKEDCAEEEYGACTVLMNGERVRVLSSCYRESTQSKNVGFTGFTMPKR